MNFEAILFDEKSNYAIAYINRPDKMNAINRLVLQELDCVLGIIQNSDTLRGLIITGAGNSAFAAGADLSEIKNCNELTGKDLSEYGSRFMSKLEEQNFPILAAINGFALGGGLELALACHMRFASENAKFGFPELNLGVIPGYGGTYRLPSCVGQAKAMELILTSRIIDAYEALNIGLVNAIFPQIDLLPNAEKIMSSILSKAPLAVSSAIQCIRNFRDNNPAFETNCFAQLCSTNDLREGINAYFEKRNPVFTGK